MTQRTLLDLWKNDPGLKEAFPNPTGPGVNPKWTLNDWWNLYGKIDNPDVELIQPIKAVDSVEQDGTTLTLGRFSETDPTPGDKGETDSNTVWLYNKKAQTYRPISSPTALMNLIGAKSVAEAMKSVTTLPQSALAQSEWKGKFISFSAAVLDDGVTPTDSPLVEGQGDPIVGIYGLNERGTSKFENEVALTISTALTPALLKGDISQTVWDKNMVSNSPKLAQYVSAIAYGDYNVPDAIYKDLKAQTLAEKGDKSFNNYKAFDTQIKADVWSATPAGKSNAENAALEPPKGILNIDVGLFKNSLYQLSGEAFATLVKPLDKSSQTFKDEVAKIETSYYDAQIQMAKADTEAAKVLANSNWETLKDTVKKKFNIDLSNNVNEAWNQIQQLSNTAAENGLAGSGIAQEAEDRYMRDVRKNTDLLRETNISENDANQKSWLTASGSSADIQSFASQSPENKKKAESWGLIPSAEMKAWFSADNLKKLYPKLDDAAIQRMASSKIDENGNYRSTLYRTLYTNKYETESAKQTFQETQAMINWTNKEEAAEKPFSTGNPYLKDQKSITEKLADPIPAKPVAYDPNGALTVSNLAAGQIANAPKSQSDTDMENIRKVFGSGWKSSTSKDLQGKGVYGAVRVKGMNDVFTLGSGGTKETADSYKQKFGTSNQQGIVGEITHEQAKALGINI